MIYKFERKLKGANQVEATGEELTINNAGRKVQKFELSGRSEQEAREGYNLLNVPSNFEITSSQNNRIIPISLKVNTTYTIQADEIDTDNTSTSPNFLFRFRYNNNDVSFERMLLRTKKSSFTTSDNVDTVWIYSGTNYDESATTNTTFKNLMIYEGTENKPYEPYTGENPSPSLEYPSKIENVGDNINLFNKNDTNCIFDTAISNNTLGIKASGTYKTVCVPCKANTIYSISKKYDEIKNRLTVACSNDMPNYSKKVENLGGSEMATNLTVTTSNTAKYLLAYVWVSGGSTTYQEMLDSIKIEEGIKATNYSDYNCGSVGVTISNKNLYKIEKVINDTNYSKIIYKDENGNVSFTTGGIPLIIAPTKTKEKTEYTYILKCKSNVTTENNINFTAIYEDGTSKLLSANKKKDTNEFIVKFKTDKEKTLAYVTQQYTNSSRTTIITEGTMILEGDYLNLEELYEIHQEQEILFPLAEGQKLYEGSYLAKDGIHNKRISINGNEYKNTAGMNRAYSTENYNCFDIYTGLKFVKSENQYKTIGALCNQFKEKNWASFWQQKVNEEGFCINQDNRSTIYIKISKEICPDIDTFKKYIDENNLLFEISLEQEEIIPYTPEQQEIYSQLQNLKLFRGCNHITVKSNVKSTIKLSYYDGELDMTDYKYNLQFKKHMQEM